MKLKCHLSLSAALLLVLSACGGGKSSGDRTDQPRHDTKPPAQEASPVPNSINGKWKIGSFQCEGKVSSASGQPWFLIDNEGGFIAYIATTEDNDDHLCLDVQQFEVLLMSGGGTSTGGVSDSTVRSGIIRKHEDRIVCRHKIDGHAQKETYKDEKKLVTEDSAYDLHLTSLKGNALTLETDEAFFCEGRKAKFELRPL